MPRADGGGGELAEFPSGRPAGVQHAAWGLVPWRPGFAYPGRHPPEAERLTLPGTPARRVAERKDRARP